MIDAAAVKAKIPLNFELIGNPINWIIVVLIVFMAGLAISLIFHHPKTGE